MRAGTLIVDIAANLARLQQDMRQAQGIVQGSMQNIERSVGSVRNAMQLLGGALSVEALRRFVQGAITVQDELGKMSQRVGVTVESLSALRYAGGLADVSFDQMAVGLRQLTKNMADMQAGTGEARMAFQAMGLSVTDSSGRLKSTEQMLLDVADKFAGMNDGASKTALAMRIFGESGAQLIPLLNEGREGLARMTEEAKRFGQVVSTEAAKAAEDFNDNVERLNKSFEGMRFAIANDALPWLVRITEQLNAAAKAAGGFWAGLNQILTVSGSQAKDPAAALQEIDQRLARLRADRAVLGGDSLGARFNRMMAPEDLSILDAQIRRAETERRILQQLLVDRVGGNASGFTEDAAGNLVPVSRTRGPALANANAAEKAKRDREAYWKERFKIEEAAYTARGLGSDALEAALAEPTDDEKVRELREKFRTASLQEQMQLMEKIVELRGMGTDALEQAYATEVDLEAVERARLKHSDDELAKREQVWTYNREQAEAYNRLIEEGARRNQEILAQSITDGIMRGFERGADFWEVFRDSIRNAALTVTIQPVVLGVAQAVTAPLAGMASGATNSLLSSMGLNALGSVGGGLSLGGVGGGLAYAGGLSTGLMADAATSAALIESGTVGAAGAGLEAAALGGFGSAAMAALPWVGGGLLLAGALGAFDGDGPAERTSQYVAGFGEGGYAYLNNQWFSSGMWGAQSAFDESRIAQEQNLIRNLRLGPDEVARVNAALSAQSGRRFSFGMEGTDPRASGAFEQIQAARLQAVSQALGRSIQELTSVMSMSAEQWQEALAQMELAVQNAESTLAQHLRGLPGQLGITALTDFQSSLATAEDRAPLDRLAAARQIYEETIARARSGDLSAIQDATSAAQSYYSIGRDVYASGGDFQSIRGEIEQSIQALREQQEGVLLEITKDVPLSIQEASNNQIAEIKAQTAAFVEKIEDLRREVQKLRG